MNNIHRKSDSTVEAFLSWGSSEILTNEILPYIAHENHKAKIILISYCLTSNRKSEIFYKAWYEYKLLNVFIINYLSESRIQACLFNPFTKNRNETKITSTDLFCTILRNNEQAKNYIGHFNNFVQNRITNLNGYTLTIAMHESEGSISAFDCILDNITLSDIDTQILTIMREKMNFTVSFVESELELSMGFVFPNGSLAGSLGLIENNHVDLAANSRIIYDYGTTNLLYLDHIGTEKLIFLVPSNYFENRDKHIIFINPFSITYIIVNFILAVIIPLISVSLEKINNYLGPLEEQTSFVGSALQTLGIIYSISWKLPTTPKKRWIIFGLLVYNIVTYAVWQAVTIGYLNSDNQYLNNINSLDELLETSLTLKVSKYHKQMVTHASSNSQNPNNRLLSERLTTENTAAIRTAVEEIITHRRSAFLISGVYVQLIKSGSYKWIDGHNTGIYAISTPVYEFYKSMVVPKTSPFVRSFNDIIARCVESGFIEYQNQQLETVVNVLEIRHQLEAEVRNDKHIFDMAILQKFFLLYLMLMALSIVVFILEIVIKPCNRCRKNKVGNCGPEFYYYN
ncbi:uncharacterized protein LOC131438256 [Malaya genurostris]|uniref:uncharacterized protein LOC131438256 n=1 Tax=Malaya genurostris TaxID=325434 RepID=UPI0026F3F18F|nr:uncharacterized protein LOC131438256 [Malaya genurostris]